MNPIGSQPEAANDAVDAEALLAAGLKAVTAAFSHPQLQPDPDQGEDRPELRAAVETFRREVLPHVTAVLSQLDATQRWRVAEGIASVTERLVGALLAAGSQPTAREL